MEAARTGEEWCSLYGPVLPAGAGLDSDLMCGARADQRGLVTCPRSHSFIPESWTRSQSAGRQSIRRQPCCPAKAATDKGPAVGKEQAETKSEQKECMSLRQCDLGAGQGSRCMRAGASIQGKSQVAQGPMLQVPAAEDGISRVMFMPGWPGQAELCEHSPRVHALLSRVCEVLRHTLHLSPGAAPHPPRSPGMPQPAASQRHVEL